MFKVRLQAWRQAAADFTKLAESVPYELRQKEGVCGEWSCQQIVAHLAGWQREALKRYEDFHRGDRSSQTYNVDAFNASSVAALKLLSWSEVLDTFRFTSEDLARRAEALSDEETEANPGYEEWLVGLRDDLLRHTSEIQQWLERNSVNG